jgi:hypothetical protein
MSILNEYLLYLSEKKEKYDPNKIEPQDVAGAAGSVVVAKKSLDHGLHRAFGLRGETHSTPDKTGIQKAGNILDPSKGGTGASRIGDVHVQNSVNRVYITGYNKQSYDALIKKGYSPEQAKSMLKIQPLYKKMQAAGYKIGGAHGQKTNLKPKAPKTFHIVGSEEFFNKHFIPDPDDFALSTNKKLKVANSRLGATVQAIKRYGFKGLKSSPKMRPVIGVGILTVGALASAGLSMPLLKKIKNKYELKHVSDLVKSGEKEKAKQYLINKKL